MGEGGTEILLIMCCCCYYFETNAGEAVPRAQRVIDVHSHTESPCLQTWCPSLTVRQHLWVRALIQRLVRRKPLLRQEA